MSDYEIRVTANYDESQYRANVFINGEHANIQCRATTACEVVRLAYLKIKEDSKPSHNINNG